MPYYTTRMNEESHHHIPHLYAPITLVPLWFKSDNFSLLLATIRGFKLIFLHNSVD